MNAFLVADIGGTHARCAQAVSDGKREGFELRDTRLYSCRDFATIDDMLERYRGEIGGVLPDDGCLAVAGPVSGDRITLTNNDWNFSGRQLQRRFGLRRLSVINDLSAIAYACMQARADELIRLRAGRAPGDAAGVAISPGTGLGVAGFVTTHDRPATIPSEAGHTAFAPVNGRQDRILAVTRARVEFVSWETLLSGPGLVNVYRAVCAIADQKPADLRPEEITARAHAASDPMCMQAVEDFVDVLAAFASHCALTFCATGGVYLAGNICRNMAPWLTTGRFVRGFRARGVMAGFLAHLPIHLLELDYPGLVGAAWHARRVRGEADRIAPVQPKAGSVR